MEEENSTEVIVADGSVKFRDNKKARFQNNEPIT